MKTYKVWIKSLIEYSGYVEIEANDEDEARKLADEGSWDELLDPCTDYTGEYSREIGDPEEIA